jgi:hypothetical protein
MTDAFYERLDDDHYRATAFTAGPWDPGAQHGGPPAALLGGAMAARITQPVARATFELLRPVPLADLEVTTRVVRPGRAVALAEATLSDADGPCVVARAWGIRTQDVDLEPMNAGIAPLPGPDTAHEVDFFDVAARQGWHTGMEIRFLEGAAFVEEGPARVWLRPRIAMVDDRPASPLERVLLAADGGNGVSSAADPSRWLFINPDLTVALYRHPVGDWIGMDAVSTYEPHGVGLATTVLHDGRGAIGRGLQTLLLAPAPS